MDFKKKYLKYKLKYLKLKDLHGGNVEEIVRFLLSLENEPDITKNYFDINLPLIGKLQEANPNILTEDFIKKELLPESDRLMIFDKYTKFLELEKKPVMATDNNLKNLRNSLERIADLNLFNPGFYFFKTSAKNDLKPEFYSRFETMKRELIDIITRLEPSQVKYYQRSNESEIQSVVPISYSLENGPEFEKVTIDGKTTIEQTLNPPDDLIMENFTKFKTDLFILQDVKGNGQCLFRSIINAFRFKHDGINLGYDQDGVNEVIIMMKNLIIQYLEFCFSNIFNKTQEFSINCSDEYIFNFYNKILKNF